MSLRPADLHQVAARTIEELWLAYPSRTILHDALGSGECTLDRDRLSQVICNLVSNAVSYGHTTEPILVRSEVHGAIAQLNVHNEGRAIPNELLTKIFEPMVRGAPGSTSVRSVGLGLFIVREIARAHRGEMNVESSDTDGTTFSMRFPSSLV